MDTQNTVTIITLKRTQDHVLNDPQVHFNPMDAKPSDDIETVYAKGITRGIQYAMDMLASERD